MPPKHSLCEYCFQISFDAMSLNQTLGNEQIEYNLGPASRVESGPCLICKLVTQAYQMRHRDMQEDDKITVTWSQILGLGRSVFHVYPKLDSDAPCICFSSPTDSDATEDAYNLKSKTHSTIDIYLISHRIASCENYHGNACRIRNTSLVFTEFPDLQVLRFIDVEAMCIVESQYVPNYVALSYVWGPVANFRLKRARRRRLLLPGSLTEVWWKLPTTIRNAISVVQKLGAQFLWLESLCLLQDDGDDLQRGVGVMDLIHGRTWLTIVACYGHDAEGGLPGVQRESRMECDNTTDVVPGVFLGVVTGGPLEIIGNAVWNFRAWMLQERFLSRRILYSTEFQAFCHCRKGILPEACFDSRSTLVGSNFLTGPLDLDSCPIQAYEHVVYMYTTRAFSNHNDALRALAGTLRRIATNMKCRLLEGLLVHCSILLSYFKALYCVEDLCFRVIPELTRPGLSGARGELFYIAENIDEFEGEGIRVDREMVRCGNIILGGFEDSTSFEQPKPFDVALL
ncbi:hypothetical protein GGR58DRAFT_525954 [Xylaria digitata]|nr:hypothetical protein GGR58DRAFT_525954 [Xylaria digitata]